MKYEVIVVGGGHAGCEASLATAKKGHRTLLITGNIENIADMPCNPSIGGSAKGVVVREIDALGGMMGKCADRGQIQMKMLNRAKGPAVQALRAQADKITYPKEMRKILESQEKLEILEAMVENIIVDDHQVKGVILEDGTELRANIVILTTGTYLKSDILVGNTRTREAPHGERPSQHLSDNLAKLGFRIIRLKTGTPPRLAKNTIHFEKTKPEYGDSLLYTFSFDNQPTYKIEDQIPCHLVYTNDQTHQIIRENLSKASMYGGLSDIKGIGPRYCPSIEDKIVRFSEKEKHQLFLEPESLYYDDIYLQGFSTSMPHDVQEQMVHSLQGLEDAKIVKYAYAIEYDAIYPTQLKQSLETKIVENLFTAGQINGTSGYEEAACQGLMAGINASLKLEGKEPLILKRNEAYIGVLIDDLVTKGVRDPYRLLTSRAEYRLLLRHDNADLRLREYGYQIGLINEQQYDSLLQKRHQIQQLEKELKETKITPSWNDQLEKIPTAPLKDGITLYDFLKRPEIHFDTLGQLGFSFPYSKEVQEQVEVMIQYAGYIVKAEREAAKMIDLDNKKIPTDIDYDRIHNLASEAKQKLKEVEPTSLGQALRISGVNPSDVSLLMIYLKKEYAHEHK